MRIGVDLLPGAESLLRAHQAELPQKDDLCGAFWGLLALSQPGIASHAAVLDQDTVAATSGTAVSPRSDDQSRPRGEGHRRDYRLDHPTLEHTDQVGTSVVGLARAISQLSDDCLQAVPVAGAWTSDSVGALLDQAQQQAEGVTLIANLATRHLWGSRPDLATVLDYLDSGADRGPEPDWDVGHFVAIVGQVQGARGRGVVVADTYRTLGHQGLHFQPLPRIAAALTRDGTRAGGILAVVRSQAAEALEANLKTRGFRLAPWDNGSIDLGDRLGSSG